MNQFDNLNKTDNTQAKKENIISKDSLKGFDNNSSNPISENTKEDFEAIIIDDPSQWTWLPNEPVTSEEIDQLLTNCEQSTSKNYSPNGNLYSGYEGFTAEGYENGKTVTNSKYNFPKENFKASDIRSSLLIPEKYLPVFKAKVREHQGVRAYISYLLHKYRIHITNGIVPAYSNLTTKYQEKDQCLRKIGFRPNQSDWAELKLYRISFGMSISAFLIYLLIADSTNFAQNLSYFLWTVGIPAVSNLDLATKVYLCQNRDFYTVILRFRQSQTY